MRGQEEPVPQGRGGGRSEGSPPGPWLTRLSPMPTRHSPHACFGWQKPPRSTFKGCAVGPSSIICPNGQKSVKTGGIFFPCNIFVVKPLRWSFLACFSDCEWLFLSPSFLGIWFFLLRHHAIFPGLPQGNQHPRAGSTKDRRSKYPDSILKT